MFTALDISTSALVAQRTRFNVISNNLANISTTRNEKGELKPYQPRHVVFQTDDSIGGERGTAGVKVAAIETADLEPLWRTIPGHPDGQGPNKDQVAFPNIKMMTEFTNALEASRAYEANLGVVDITKDLANQTLRILA